MDSELDLLSQYIATEILKQPRRKIQPDEPIISSGLIDSFNLINLALFVEKTFGVYIKDNELNANTFDDLNGLMAIINSRRQA